MMTLQRKYDRIFAALSFFIGFIVYWSSVAPTTSFWDCGEFIACSYTMGVPHPPGSPLFLLLGKVMSMLPIASDIGLRVNMLSVLFSAFSLMFLYLSISRFIRIYRGPDQTWLDSFIVGMGSLIGTLALGFSYSFWFNAVEAEVYAASTFFTAIALWLILKWTDHADQPWGDKILLILAYSVGLATGVHLLNLLAVWTIFQIMYFHKFEFKWKSFILMNALATVAFLLIYPGVVKYIPRSMLTISVAAPVIVIAALIIGLNWSHKNRQRIAALSIMAMLLVILGYSTYSLIFVRSTLQPRINENHPDNLEKLVYYLEREQYGKIDPFQRRWEGQPEYSSTWDFFWTYQVNHMYNRYLMWQFVGMKGDNQNAGVDFSKFWGLPFLLGLIGLFYHFQRDTKRAFSVFTLFFMAGYGIILYINQNDPQPRERDYSYVASFYAFAIWIGIGASYLLDLSRHLMRKSKQFNGKAVAAASVLVFVLVPGNMLLKNYNMAKRSGNYVAWDYSHNILESCEPNAILFTNGDNDTFPLWYLQEVEHIRRDIRVVNLSLLNTGWYIKQLKYDEPKVPISLSDDYIDKYIDGRDVAALRRRYWPGGQKMVSIKTPEGEYKWEVPATVHIPVSQDDDGTNNFLRVQDIMILNIMQTSQEKRPLYYAVTVSNSNMLNLRDYLTMDGLVFRLRPNKSTDLINPDLLKTAIFEKFEGHYRGLNNPRVHLPDFIEKLLQNYRSAFLQLAYHYYRIDQPGIEPEPGAPLEEQYAMFDSLSSNAKVNLILRWMDRNIPEDIHPLNNPDISIQIGKMYYETGHPEELEKRLDALSHKADWLRKVQYAAMYKQFLSRDEKAAQLFDESLDEVETAEDSVRLINFMGRVGEGGWGQGILDEIRFSNPSDQIKAELAAAYYSMNQDTIARNLYEEVIQTNFNNPRAVGGLMLTYERMGEYQEALELVNRWLQLYPGDEQAVEKREQYQKMAASG